VHILEFLTERNRCTLPSRPHCDEDTVYSSSPHPDTDRNTRCMLCYKGAWSVGGLRGRNSARTSQTWWRSGRTIPGSLSPSSPQSRTSALCLCPLPSRVSFGNNGYVKLLLDRVVASFVVSNEGLTLEKPRSNGTCVAFIDKALLSH
jgi:hypothetical protein